MDAGNQVTVRRPIDAFLDQSDNDRRRRPAGDDSHRSAVVDPGAGCYGDDDVESKGRTRSAAVHRLPRAVIL